MTTKTTKTIITPRGRRMTLAAYFALSRAAYSTGRATQCAAGCMDCAPWRNGPCAWEVRDELEELVGLYDSAAFERRALALAMAERDGFAIAGPSVYKGAIVRLKRRDLRQLEADGLVALATSTDGYLMAVPLRRTCKHCGRKYWTECLDQHEIDAMKDGGPCPADDCGPV